MPVQTKLIDSANEFLSHLGSSVQLNKDGVCGGLVSLYVRYALQGKDKKREFFKLSKKLANIPADYSIGEDSALAIFIGEIEIEFNRFKYSKGHYFQGDIDSSVLIDGKPIKKEFSLGLVNSADRWTKIMEQIRNEGRACYVRSHNHAIAVSFIDNEYEIYDPNYDEDNDDVPNAIENNVRRFKNPADVLAELSKQFGYPDGSDVGLGIIVYAHPVEKKPATYPDQNLLLAESLKTITDFDKKIAIQVEDWNYNSLFFATNINDRTTVEYHLQNNQISLIDCAYLMQMDSNNQTVFDVYLKTTKESDKQTLIYYSIWAGNTELFQKMTDHYQKEFVKTQIQRQEFKRIIENNFSLGRAAKSRNQACILQIFDLYEKYAIPFNTIKETELIKIIEDLTKNGDITLLNAISKKINNISKEAVFAGIRTAAKHDKREALGFWLKLSTTQSKSIDNTLINEELMRTCSLLNFQQIMKAGVSVNPSLYREALKRNRKEFFEEALKTNPTSRWGDFYSKLTTNKLESPIDLFTEYEGISALDCLISYQANDLIKKNWPEGVTPVAGAKALAFAYESGNQAVVQFLTQKGFKVETSFQIDQLNKAVESNDHKKIEAILASHIDFKQFFNKSNKKLIKGLMRIGKSQFIINAWNDYTKDNKNTKQLDPEIISIEDLLWNALLQNNKGLIEFIANKEIKSTLKYLKILINSENPIFYNYAINLAQALDEKVLHKFIKSELRAYDKVLFERTTKDDERADKIFRANAREMIRPLTSILIYAIEQQYFSFAEKMLSQVNLSPNELLELFIHANENKKDEISRFLITNYRYLSTDIYLKLAETNHFDLLATLLERKESLDPGVYITLLKKATQAHHERTIQLLAPYINTAYKIEGTVIYQAINEENVKGTILLLKYQNNSAELPLPQTLLSTAMKQNDDALLHAAFQKPMFINYFKNEFSKNSHNILKNGTPEAVLYIYKHVNQDDFFTGFLNHAIASNDVALFKQLQKNKQFTSLSRQQLFNQACEMKAPGIVNELLTMPMEFTDKQALHEQLDKLFNVDTNESKIDAHDIYNLIYKQALHRLYEFVKFYRYRPFASLHQSISELINDTKLPQDSPLKNYLFQRALDEGDQQKLDKLLKQLENLPPLNENCIELFSNNLDKQLVIGVLLRHYPLNDVLAKAAEFGNWQTVASLLHGRHSEEITPILIDQLKNHDLEIIKAIEEDAKNHLQDDPRHKLDDLLIAKNNLALGVVLNNKKEQIENIIMNVQHLMVEQKIDLKAKFYRFDLNQQLLKSKQALEDLTHKMELLFERYKDVPEQTLVQNEQALNELREIKKQMKENDLVPAYFEYRDELEHAFDVLSTIDKEKEAEALKQQQETETLKKQGAGQDFKQKQQTQPKLPTINPLDGLIKILKDYLVEREAEDYTHHWFSIFQYTKKDKREAAKHFINSLQNAPQLINSKDKAALNDGRLHFRIHEYLEANQTAIQQHFKQKKPIKTVDQLIGIINQQDPVAKLIYLLECYQKDRSKEAETYHFSIFPQYTRTDKLKAVEGLIGNLRGQPSKLDNNQKGALKQGSLGSLVSGFINEFNVPLKNALQTKQIKNLDDLIEACGQNKIPQQPK